MTKTQKGNEAKTDDPLGCYVIVEGKFYSEGYTLCVCKTKKTAVRKCRDDGFSYCKKDDLWNGEYFGKSYYRRVEREDFYT